jgi:hypothetical protein
MRKQQCTTKNREVLCDVTLHSLVETKVSNERNENQQEVQLYSQFIYALMLDGCSASQHKRLKHTDFCICSKHVEVNY